MVIRYWLLVPCWFSFVVMLQRDQYKIFLKTDLKVRLKLLQLCKNTVVSPFPWVICSKTYRGWLKLR